MSQLREEQTKRLLLNVLMQGAAIEASSSLVNVPELDRLDPRLNDLNQFAGVGMQLSQFEAKSILLTGWTAGEARRFWKSANRKSHPFVGSRLIREHGLALAESTYDDAVVRAEAVGMLRKGPRSHDRRLLETIKDIHHREQPHRNQVADIACSVVSREWAIPPSQLRGTLHHKNRPGLMLDGQQSPAGVRQWLNSACAAGWSRVVFGASGPPLIEAAALTYSLLVHELAKGTAELCCAHGLAQLDDETYNEVIRVTDKVTLERSGMQVGPALFRRWVEFLPQGVTPAIGLTHLSISEPDVVETVLIAVLEDGQAARQIMAQLCRDSISDAE